MRFSIIALKVYRVSYSMVADLLEAVIAGFIAQSATYTTPPVTTLTANTQLASLRAAIARWRPGPPGSKNRGSHQDFLDVKDATAVAIQTLNVLAAYAEATTPGDRTSLNSLNFTLRQIPRQRVGTLQAVRNLRHVISPKVPIGQVKIGWEKPLDTIGVVVNSYKVKRGTTSDYAAAEQIAVVTRTSFIDIAPPTPGVNLYYFVVPVNASGDGVYEVCIASATAP